jgi:hypothetical protein
MVDQFDMDIAMDYDQDALNDFASVEPFIFEYINDRSEFFAKYNNGIGISQNDLPQEIHIRHSNVMIQIAAIVASELASVDDVNLRNILIDASINDYCALIRGAALYSLITCFDCNLVNDKCIARKIKSVRDLVSSVGKTRTEVQAGEFDHIKSSFFSEQSVFISNLRNRLIVDLIEPAIYRRMKYSMQEAALFLFDSDKANRICAIEFIANYWKSVAVYQSVIRYISVNDPCNDVRTHAELAIKTIDQNE